MDRRGPRTRPRRPRVTGPQEPREASHRAHVHTASRGSARSGPASLAPSSGTPLQRLKDGPFDQLNDHHEGDAVGQYAGHVELLEIELDLEADAIASSQQLDDQHDLPNERQAG